MRWASVLSEEGRSESAARDASTRLRTALDGAPDLLLVFASHHHAGGWTEIERVLGAEHAGATALGCSAQSVIGAGRELETSPGLALAGARLPGVTLKPFWLAPENLGEGDAPEIWRGLAPASGPPAQFLLLADPFSFDTEGVLHGLDLAHPDSVKVGGLASGGSLPGENTLLVGGELRRSGLAGVALSGNLAIDPVVAQGCRPIGAPLFVTHSRHNILQRVDGQPPIEVIERLFAEAGPAERELFRTSLFLGIEMEPGRGEYRQGDFLIRNIVGMDPEDGSLAVAAELQPAQVVQFHLRDAATSAEDLERQLAGYGSQAPAGAARGALLFSCLGRGRGLYGRPDHDSAAFRARFGDVPLAGFFCNGEIGPVQRRTFLHGYTSAFAIFRER